MKLNVVNFDNKEVGTIEVTDAAFGAPQRNYILARVIHWQLSKRRSGNHKSKGISDIRGTTKKPNAQKHRGGATIFGPVVRDHGYSLPKKVRRLAMRTALSTKQAEGKLIIIDETKVAGKTSALAKSLRANGWASVLIVDGQQVGADL